MMMQEEKIRAVSWWLTWKDLAWPDEDVRDAIERRADAAAKSGVNCAVIFGAHFRWDFMPLWQNLHDLLAAIREALHRRDIQLFDHHSAVLTHRYSDMREAQRMRTFNRHHIPFAPSREAAASWTFNGEYLNDWRMIDIPSGKPVFLEPYTAEEFCINNPGFRRAYCKYVRRLVAETGIDGLMCDDGIFYSGWTSCGCQWCRKKFREEYGHELPPVDRLDFWGNYDSKAFKDWITLRFRSAGEFMAHVRQVLDRDFPLLSCCSSSAHYTMPKFGLSYQELCGKCNYIMLEMTGNSPEVNGCWDTHFPEQSLHLGLARQYDYPCIGLGYGYSECTAELIWAYNKFIGSSTWFSTLKGRLGLPDSKLSGLKDDSELVRRAYNWEKNHLRLFAGTSNPATAVFFSRHTRDYYSMTAEDYTLDYYQCCLELLNHNLTFDVVAEIPDPKDYPSLTICSAICLDDTEYEALNQFIRNGGTVIASGPLGSRDRTAVVREKPWLEQYGIQCEIFEPERPAAFPPAAGMQPVVPLCRGVYRGSAIQKNSWIKTVSGKGCLYWTPARMQCDSGQMNLSSIILHKSSPLLELPTAADSGWRFRQFRLADGKIILHALAAEFDVSLMNDLEMQRKNQRGNHLISMICRRPSRQELIIGHQNRFRQVRFYAPLANREEDVPTTGSSEIKLRIPAEVFYFILEITI